MFNRTKVGALQLTEGEARRSGPCFVRRFVNRWSVFQASEKVVRERILAADGHGRMADTVDTLLASYWAFVSSRQATAEGGSLTTVGANLHAPEADARVELQQCPLAWPERNRLEKNCWRIAMRRRSKNWGPNEFATSGGGGRKPPSGYQVE